MSETMKKEEGFSRENPPFLTYVKIPSCITGMSGTVIDPGVGMGSPAGNR